MAVPVAQSPSSSSSPSTGTSQRRLRRAVAWALVLAGYGNALAALVGATDGVARTVAAVAGPLAPLAGVLGWHRGVDGGTPADLGLHCARWRTAGAWGLLAGLALAVPPLLAFLLPLPSGLRLEFAEVRGIERHALLFRVLVTTPLLVVLVEEVAFRGFLLHQFRRALPEQPRAAVALGSLAFALWHVTIILRTLGETNVAAGVAPLPLAIACGLIGVIVAGLVFGGVYRHTGNLLAPFRQCGDTSSVIPARAAAASTSRCAWRVVRCPPLAPLRERKTGASGAIAEATRLRNQLHQLLLQLDPEYQAHLPRLRSAAGLAALEAYTAPTGGPIAQGRAAAVRRLAQRLRLALAQADEIAEQIRQRAQEPLAALTGICGVSLLTAGALAGILGPGQRFRTDAQLAAFAGVAPLEASSAGRVRHRLNRGGNRRLNAILHRIAVAQARCAPAARTYLAHRQADGKSRREALRAFKRFLIRAVWRAWQDCLPATTDRPHLSTAMAA